MTEPKHPKQYHGQTNKRDITQKSVTRPILEYTSIVWSPIASTTNITKLQRIQNTALCIATGLDTNMNHEVAEY